MYSKESIFRRLKSSNRRISAHWWPLKSDEQTEWETSSSPRPTCRSRPALVFSRGFLSLRSIGQNCALLLLLPLLLQLLGVFQDEGALDRDSLIASYGGDCILHAFCTFARFLETNELWAFQTVAFLSPSFL